VAIGSVLLQPQRLERAGRIPPDQAILVDVLSLVVHLSVDGAQGAPIGQALLDALAGTVTRLATRAGAGINSAVTRLRAVFMPLVTPAQTALTQPLAEGAALFDVLEQGLTSIVQALQNVSPEPLRQSAGTLVDILTTDLGITPTFIHDVVLGVFDDMALALWSDLFYESVLSCLTLTNHQEPTQAAHQRPENYKENGGFVDLFWKSGLLVYAAAVPDEEYALPFETVPLTIGYWLGGALGVGLVMGFVGLLVAQGVVAQTPVFADTGHVVKTLGKSTGKSLLYFWPYLKLVKEKN